MEDEALEIEVKFHAADPGALRARLAALGAELLGSVFEVNVLYDDALDSLSQRGGLLRLRRDGACRLTAKLPPENADRRFKVMREWEVTVSDASAMENILAALGFCPRRRYEKERETWLLGGAHVTVDRLGFGFFVEIEGRAAEIPRVAALLGFSWERRIIRNYLEIFAAIKKGEGWSAQDPTFALLDGLSVDIEKYLPLLEQGH